MADNSTKRALGSVRTHDQFVDALHRVAEANARGANWTEPVILAHASKSFRKHWERQAQGQRRAAGSRLLLG